MPSSRNASGTDLDPRALGSLVLALRALPRPREVDMAQLRIPDVVCRCQKRKRVTDMVVTRSPLVKRIDTDVCKDCPCKAEHARYDQSTARLVCVGCGSLLANIPASENKETKLKFRAGGIYHALGCPNCSEQVRLAVTKALNSNADPNKVVEFESKIFEVLYVTNPTLARTCLAKVLHPNL